MHTTAKDLFYYPVNLFDRIKDTEDGSVLESLSLPLLNICRSEPPCKLLLILGFDAKKFSNGFSGLFVYGTDLYSP